MVRLPEFQCVLDIRFLGNDRTLGFLAVYAASTESLTDAECRRVEFIGRRISMALANMLGLSKTSVTALTGFAQEQRTES